MLKDFKALKIALASPQQILSWSNGEVKKAETINYRTHRTEVDGLMDEKIFGPTKNYECYCGKYKKIRYKGIICDKCGVEVTHKRVRRERLGHIKLASPVTHVWFAYGVPNKLATILNIQQKKLETVIYFSRYIVTSVDEEGRKQALDTLTQAHDEQINAIKSEQSEELAKLESVLKDKIKDAKKSVKTNDKLDMQVQRLETSNKKEIAKLKSIYDQRIKSTEKKLEDQQKLISALKEGTTLSEEEFADIQVLNVGFMDAGMGAEAIFKLLAKIDVAGEITGLKEEVKTTRSKLRIKKIIQKLRVFEGMNNSAIDPKWIVMEFLPVLPPDLRPIIQLPGGRFATSDLNDLYRRVINRNNRLKRLIDLGAPEIILRNEKRMLQESVDALIDNSHRPGTPVLNSRQQPYKSLSDMLRGKQGRFRQNLLGKRVDFSGRSVIVSGPDLSINQCGLPKTMALELFKPFVLHEIIAQGFAQNIKSAKNFYDEGSDKVWDILEQVIQNRPVLLNRAPTLHKQGIQAFFPVLVEGNAIRLHPLVCKGFNADFDGDQMAVHVPLSEKAIEEVKERMFPRSNILLMADGRPVINTEKDMAFGVFYLTGTDNDNAPEKAFPDVDRAIGAYEGKEAGLRENIFARVGENVIKTTIGRLIFNQILPEGYAFVNEQLNKKLIANISAKILEDFGSDASINFLDKVEELGFKFATLSGFSISMKDFVISEHKDELLEKIAKQEEQLIEYYEQGLLSNDERRKRFENIWLNIVDEVAKITWKEYEGKDNNLVKLNQSGAAPVENPLKQISGIRGLIIDPSGKVVELPLRSNYKQGLNSLEYFVAARGTRKALADVALKTAESGYLTRKLVDVAQDVITKEEDCGTEHGVYVNRTDIRRIDFVDRLTGRFTAKEVKGKDGVIIAAQELITAPTAQLIAADESIEKVEVRSVLKCKSLSGICNKCYGYNLGTRKVVEAGIAVGVIAAQAIGEASTQLTLDAKHRSGSATAKDITQGLPRVEELVEARTPKAKSILSEVSGKVKVVKDEAAGIKEIIITPKEETAKVYDTTDAKDIAVNRTKKVKAGELLFIDSVGEEIISPFPAKATIKDEKLTLTYSSDSDVRYEVGIWDQIFVETGSVIEKGQQLTPGSIDPKEMLDLLGLEATQKYIIDSIQDTFGSQGIGIDDKHVEIAVKQMSRFVLVSSPGDSGHLPGDFLDNNTYIFDNKRLDEEGKKKIKARRQIMGLSNASLRTESFLSAASFQDQVRVLTEAAILGKEDGLMGLKENVIIGRPVPLGKEVR
jgi:DNA-directed RNA polymerase subunit beta'